MISIIICSANRELCNNLTGNISETIGVVHEVVSIDNSTRKYGICEAYNLGAQKSKFKYLCFIHEDILFKTNNWGEKIELHLENENIGLIGVAGGVAKTKFHSSWWYNLQNASTQRKNIVQYVKAEKIHEYENPLNEAISKVLFIDGVFMACRKDIWEQNQFDELTFPKFHFYDLDFSFSISQKHNVIVVYDILIEHLSKGSYNKEWLLSAEVFTKKWKRFFPKYLNQLTNIEKNETEKQAIRFFLEVCIQEKVLLKSIKSFFRYLLKLPDIKSTILFTKRIIRLFVKRVLD